MKALLQRVISASVRVGGEQIAAIDKGLLVFLGVEPGDTAEQVDQLLDRIIHYRVFADAAGGMNLSLETCAGQLLAVPQFTLAADTRKGRRPGFSNAAGPAMAKALFDQFVTRGSRCLGSQRLQSGRFGADMQVALINDGPVTFWMESDGEQLRALERT